MMKHLKQSTDSCNTLLLMVAIAICSCASQPVCAQSMTFTPSDPGFSFTSATVDLPLQVFANGWPARGRSSSPELSRFAGGALWSDRLETGRLKTTDCCTGFGNVIGSAITEAVGKWDVQIDASGAGMFYLRSDLYTKMLVPGNRIDFPNGAFAAGASFGQVNSLYRGNVTINGNFGDVTLNIDGYVPRTWINGINRGPGITKYSGNIGSVRFDLRHNEVISNTGTGAGPEVSKSRSHSFRWTMDGIFLGEKEKPMKKAPAPPKVTPPIGSNLEGGSYEGAMCPEDVTAAWLTGTSAGGFGLQETIYFDEEDPEFIEEDSGKEPSETERISIPCEVSGSFLTGASSEGFGGTEILNFDEAFPGETPEHISPAVSGSFLTSEPTIGYGYFMENDNRFRSYEVPDALAGGDDMFSIHYQGTSYDLLAGQTFDFLSIDPLGVESFLLMGIDESELIGVEDQSNPPFLFGATFMDPGYAEFRSFAITTVPEPGTAAMLLIAMLTLAFSRRTGMSSPIRFLNP